MISFVCAGSNLIERKKLGVKIKVIDCFVMIISSIQMVNTALSARETSANAYSIAYIWVGANRCGLNLS